MDVGTGTSVERLRNASDLSLRGRGLNVLDAATGSMGFGATGGLLETFDAVFRATVDPEPNAKADLDSTSADSTASSDLQPASKQDSKPDDSAAEIGDSKDAHSAEAEAVTIDELEVTQEDQAQAQDIEQVDKAGTKPEELTEPGLSNDALNPQQTTSDDEDDPEESPIDGAVVLASIVVAQNSIEDTVDIEQTTQVAPEAATWANIVREKGKGDKGQAEEQAIVPQESKAGTELDGGQTVEETESVKSTISDQAVAEESTGDQKNTGRDRRGGARYSDKKKPTEQDVLDRLALLSKAGDNSEAAREAQKVLVRELQELSMQNSEDGQFDFPPEQLNKIENGSIANDKAPVAEAGKFQAVSEFAGTARSSVSANNTAASESGASENRIGSTEAGSRKDDAYRSAGVESKSVRGGTNEAQVRLVQRVSRAFQRLGPDGGRVNIMLHPAELGSVKLELQIEGNSMNAKLTAESETAASILRENLPELRQKLQDAGMVVANFDLQVGDQQFGGSGGQAFQFGQGDQADSWQRPQRQMGRVGQNRGSSIAEPSVTPSIGAEWSRNVRTGLDLQL